MEVKTSISVLVSEVELKLSIINHALTHAAMIYILGGNLRDLLWGGLGAKFQSPYRWHYELAALN
jgi:peptidase E